MAPGGELTYAMACSLIIGVVWIARKDIITRGVLMLFAVIIYMQISTGTWNQDARELRRRTDRQGKEALKRLWRKTMRMFGG